MHLCARGEAEEVNALGHAVNADLFSAFGNTLSHHLTHAIVHYIAVLGIATVDVKDTIGVVRINGKFSSNLFEAHFSLHVDTFWEGASILIIGNDAVGEMDF